MRRGFHKADRRKFQKRRNSPVGYQWPYAFWRLFCRLRKGRNLRACGGMSQDGTGDIVLIRSNNRIPERFYETQRVWKGGYWDGKYIKTQGKYP